MLRLYDYGPSGNCYKVRLALSQLGADYVRNPVDLLRGETRTPEFAERSPLQKIPVLEWPDGRRLTESNAILFHLADGTALLPDDPWQRARVLEWQSFEQFSLTRYIGSVRFWALAGSLDANAHLIDEYRARGRRALQILDDHLSTNSFLVGDRYGIADISLYAYTHVAPEGGIDLGTVNNIRAWIDRVESQPDYVSIAD